MVDKLKARLSRREKGFTLIELLVVIAIIAILVLIVVVVINPAQRIKDANDATSDSDVRSTASGIGACITKYLSDNPSGDPYTTSLCGSSSYLTTNGYLQNVPNGISFGAVPGSKVCVSKPGGNGTSFWDSSTGSLRSAGDGSSSTTCA